LAPNDPLLPHSELLGPSIAQYSDETYSDLQRIRQGVYMNDKAAQPIDIPEHKRASFKALTGQPVLAVKTVALAVILVASILSMDVLASLQLLPLWLACVINSACYYALFSVAHDGIHRALSTYKRVNDTIAQLGVTLLLPYVPLSLLRWAHMEHHRFTNEERDPDRFFHGAGWTLPLRWALMDVHYSLRALRSDNAGVKRLVKEAIPTLLAGFTFIAAVIAMGYGIELLLLWFIPSRVALLLTGFSFFWLPHAHAFGKHGDLELRQSHNKTLATVVRTGSHWILNPLLQLQNYHLIHHLWPTTPFYNNKRVWDLLTEELSQRDLAMAHGFNIQPELKISKSNKEV